MVNVTSYRVRLPGLQALNREEAHDALSSRIAQALPDFAADAKTAGADLDGWFVEGTSANPKASTILKAVGYQVEVLADPSPFPSPRGLAARLLFGD